MKIKTGTDESRVTVHFFVRPRALAHLQNQIKLLSVRFPYKVSGIFGQMRARMCKCAHLGEISIGQKAPKGHLRLEVFVNKSPSSKAKGLKALQTFLDQFMNL